MTREPQNHRPTPGSPGAATPLVRTPLDPAETMANVMVPPTPGTTPRTETAAEMSRREVAKERRSRRTNPPPTDPDLPPEPTSVDEATGPWNVDGPTPRRTSTTRRPRKDGRPTRRATLRDDVDAAAWPAADAGTTEPDRVRDAVERLSDAAQPGASRRSTATAANWEEFLAVLFGFLSMIYVWWLVSGFEVSKAEQDNLMLTEDEADGIARPMARILARSWINQAYGKHVLGASDYVVLAIVVAEYARRTSPYLRRKITSVVPGRRSRPVPGIDPETLRRRAAEEAARNGHVDAAAPGPRPVVVRPLGAT